MRFNHFQREPVFQRCQAGGLVFIIGVEFGKFSCITELATPLRAKTKAREFI
jgi:hypothetical protein